MAPPGSASVTIWSKLCTCTGDTAGSCKGPKKTLCDGHEGRDNALGEFLYQIRKRVQDHGGELRAAEPEDSRCCTNTILIKISGYNGTPDDAAVEVTWYASADFDMTNPTPPKWDGTDTWSVLST